MASACGRPSVLLRPASEDDALREREAYRYYQPLQDLLGSDDEDSHLPDAKPHSSPDRALTAFAQLAAFRLNVRRTFISLIDRKYQYILAEATKTLSLQKDTVDDVRDSLWVGMTQFERQNTPCEYAAGLLVAPDLLAAEDKGDVIVFPDLSTHVLFATHSLVTEKPHGRFYAGVPIISPSGYNIGVLCALDDKPRPGLTPTETEFLKDMAMTVMSHLEMVRAKDELGRSQNMVQGLGTFVDGKANLKDWWDNMSFGGRSQSKRRPRMGSSRSEDRSSRQSTMRGASFRPTVSPDSDSRPTLNPKRSLDSHSLRNQQPRSPLTEKSPSFHDRVDVANDLQEESISADVRFTFQRAAEIIRDSVDVDGAIFLDASVGTFAGLVDGIQHQSGSYTGTSNAGSANSAATDESFKSLDDKPCIVLGKSLASKPAAPHAQEPMSPLSVNERFLQTLLAKYPKGRIWNYDQIDDDVIDGINDKTSGFRAAEYINRRGERWRERRMIQKLFPGARSLAIVGMWDPHRSRWFAGSILWTCSPTRILSIDNELNYMVAFGQSIMAEIARIDVKMADKAKATFISSISHELRTPLHGIMGSSECLQSTDLDAFQSGLINTIETCGKTLLDTFDNLLSFAKINNLTNSSNYRRPSVPSTKADSIRKGADSVLAPVDLSVLAEEVIDTAFAGRLATDTGGITSSDSTTGSSRGLDKISVVLDYDTDQDWVFTTQAGGWIRVILNLVGNSLKYTEAGYVTVRLDARPLPNSDDKEGETEVMLTVTDTGKGMTEEFLRSGVFSPFVQEDPLSPGTGLGLSIVRQIITQLGGTISVQSKKNQGTWIQVIVCMKHADSSTEPAKSPIISRVSRLLRDKRVNMVGPTDHPDSIEFVELCKKWFGGNVILSSEPQDADIYILNRKHAEALAAQFASKPYHQNPLAMKPLVVCCKDFVSAHALKSSNSMSVINCCVEYMSQPLGPNKVAKTLSLCFDRINTCSTMGPSCSRPGSPAVRTLSSRPQFGSRRGSQRSIGSKGSNPEIVLYTPSEEETQEALFVKAKQSVEVAKKAESLDTQMQALMPAVPSKLPLTGTTGVSVLLVDDNNINLNLLATFMKKQKHAYETATNGLEALNAYQAASGPSPPSSVDSGSAGLRARAYDFVLMDINMPVMDGLESTRQMRAYERSRGLRPATIVALTGMASAQAQQEAFASGVDLFLTKPVRLKELTKILEGRSSG